MRVLVTGATGFIGVPLCRALAERGHRVSALVRPGSDWSELHGIDNVQIVYGTVRSKEWISQLDAVDCVMHLAADWDRLDALDDAVLLRRLVEIGVRRMVFFSSICAAGLDHCRHPIPDDAPPTFDAADFYGRYKWEAEQALRSVAREAGVKLAVLRPTIVYGPGDQGNLAPLIEAIGQQRLALWGHGQTPMRLCGLDNLVRVAVTAGTEGGLDGLTVNVADCECLTLRQICCRLADAMGLPFQYRNHRFLLAKQSAWLRFVTNRFELTDSFATHFAYAKWTRAFDADIARLRQALPDARPDPFRPELALAKIELDSRPPLRSLPVRCIRAWAILAEILRFRMRRRLARGRSSC